MRGNFATEPRLQRMMWLYISMSYSSMDLHGNQHGSRFILSFPRVLGSLVWAFSGLFDRKWVNFDAA